MASEIIYSSTNPAFTPVSVNSICQLKKVNIDSTHARLVFNIGSGEVVWEFTGVNAITNRDGAYVDIISTYGHSSF